MPGRLTIDLPDDLHDFVEGEVARGSSASGTDYVASVLRERRDRTADAVAVRRMLDRGIATADGGIIGDLDRAVEEVLGTLSDDASDESRIPADGRETEAMLLALDAALAEGLDDIAAGRTIPLDEAFSAVRRNLGLSGSGIAE